MDQTVIDTRTHCIRCGECCLSSSPTLHLDDVDSLKGGFIEKRNLYTIREGELVRDNVRGRMKITDRELIKVRERPDGGGCVCYDEEKKGCVIYKHRPLQCVALACWDESKFMVVYKRPTAVRKDFIADGVLLGLIEEHDRRCGYGKLGEYVRQIESEGERAVQRILELLKFDYNLRLLVSRKLAVDHSEIDLIFGRPLTETITMFGLKVVLEPGGTFLLTAFGLDHSNG